MNKLIIITGVSGTGKTTLAKMLYKKIEDSTLLIYDELTENIYDFIGFKNIEQKKSLQLLNKKIYKRLLEECMRRKDKTIIVERPFQKNWIRFFEKLSKQYEYEVYTINMFAKDFETIWERLLKRENSKQERHPSHYLDSYCSKKKDEYKPYFEYDYHKHKKEYDKLVSNLINLGTVINIADIENLNLDEIIENLQIQK